MKRSIVCCLLCVLLLSFMGCGEDVREAPTKTFTDAGLTITLTEAFTKTEMEGYTLCYDSTQVAVFCIENAFDDYPLVAKMTFDEYVEMIVEANTDKDADELTDVNGVPCLEYTASSTTDGKVYHFFTAIMEAEDAYWLVQFVCEDALYQDFRPTFVEWLDTVTFESSTETN